MITEAEALSLIGRARAGDQNAMGLIAATHAAAEQGSPEAKKCDALFLRVIEKNPVPPTAMAFEADPPLAPAAADLLGQLKSVTDKNHAVASVDHDKGRLRAACDCLLALAQAGEPKAAPIAVLILANGMPLSAPRIAWLCTLMPTRAACVSFQGAVVGMTDADRKTVFGQAGTLIERARALQMARKGKLDQWCPIMAHELGVAA